MGWWWLSGERTEKREGEKEREGKDDVGGYPPRRLKSRAA